MTAIELVSPSSLSLAVNSQDVVHPEHGWTAIARLQPRTRKVEQPAHHGARLTVYSREHVGVRAKSGQSVAEVAAAFAG